MGKFIYFFCTPVIISLVLFFSILLLGFFSLKRDKEKSSPFECGFFSFSMGGLPFSIPFFVISMVFILFDVEILLVSLYPLCYSITLWSTLYFWLVLLIIFLATVYE